MESRNHLVTTEECTPFDPRAWADEIGQSIADRIDQMVLDHIRNDPTYASLVSK